MTPSDPIARRGGTEAEKMGQEKPEKIGGGEKVQGNEIWRHKTNGGQLARPKRALHRIRQFPMLFSFSKDDPGFNRTGCEDMCHYYSTILLIVILHDYVYFPDIRPDVGTPESSPMPVQGLPRLRFILVNACSRGPWRYTRINILFVRCALRAREPRHGG
jgi:hypothetical protein